MNVAALISANKNLYLPFYSNFCGQNQSSNFAYLVGFNVRVWSKASFFAEIYHCTKDIMGKQGHFRQLQ